MATGEVFGWPDGSVWFWTGAGGSSAVVAYATETTVREYHGAENFQTLDGTYHNVATGRMCQVTIGAMYCADVLPLETMASAQTAVHVQMHQANGLGSAGRVLYSGFIDNLEIAGRERDMYRVNMTYHANVWSAY